MESLITITNLNKRIRGKLVLNNINLRISRGTVTGFVGPNGSGKTMLFRAILGFLNIPKGTVMMDESVTKGAIIENPSFIDNFTGLENLKYLASIKNVITDEEVRAAMESVDLDPQNPQKVKTYSLGMKQRLAFAQAIMENPDLLVLDEPTRGLDADGIPCFHGLIRQHQERGATILIASHNPDDIDGLCNSVYTLNHGTILM